MSSRTEVNYWAEGETDRAAARKLISSLGGVPGADYSTRRGASPGKDFLDRRIDAFNKAAVHSRWLVLRDSDGACAAHLRKTILPAPNGMMCFRIVIPAIEAWLMADRDAFAQQLGVAASRVPEKPEALRDAKGALLALASKSNLREVRSDLLPRHESGRSVGPGYALFLINFIETSWSPRRAKTAAPSLNRTVERLSHLLVPRK